MEKYLIYGSLSGLISAFFEAIMFYVFDFLSSKPAGYYQFTAIGIRLLHISGFSGEIYGLLMHFLVGTIVAFFASLIVYYVTVFNINSAKKGLFIGLLAGLVILLIFSLPINIFLLHLYIYEEYYLPSTIFYYLMHIFYGSVWGIFLGLFISRSKIKYNYKENLSTKQHNNN